MREIKFRHWDKKRKRMEYEGHLVRYDGKQDENEVLMQYTGLKDKNGVEIYESDMVRYEVSKCSHCKKKDFLNERVSFGSLGATIFGQLLWERTSKSEVVGNIYENPKL